MYSITPQAKSYKATGMTPLKNAYKKGVHVLHLKSREVVCMPCFHIMGPHFIPDAYYAMGASSKKELDASERIAIAPMISLLLP